MKTTSAETMNTPDIPSAETEILLTPEDSKAGACIIKNGPLGAIYVQCIDAYGYQRELALTISPEEIVLHVYQHPGRRAFVSITARQCAKVIDLFSDSRKYPYLFSIGVAKNSGFVHIQEALFRGESVKQILRRF